jgi:SPP1 gp7 family putative phage head morphogenesis protein
MRLSIRTQKDPSQAGGIIRAYEKEVVRLFKPLKLEIRGLLVGVRVVKLAVRDEVTESASNITKQVEWVMKSKRSKLEQIARAATNQSYQAGVIRSTQFLNGIGIEASVSTMPVDKAALDMLEMRNLASLMGVSDDTEKRIKQEVMSGMLAGEGATDIAKRIDEAVDLGIARAETVARTEVMTAFAKAAEERYKAHGVAQVEWLAAYDERVCDSCGPLMGQKFPIDDHPECPLHPNCRCVLLPVIEEA